MSRSGAHLALLLLGVFRSLAQEATEQLALCGYADFRPAHDFAMRAIVAGADNASELARRLSVSKQAAAKTIALLEERGYVERDLHAQDARRKHLQLTSLGFKVLQTGEQIFDELRAQWGDKIGMDKLEMIESILTERLKASPRGSIDPGWIAQEGNILI